MAGFVGERARRKKRNTLLIFILIILGTLIYLIFSKLQLDENLPSDTLLPNEEEIASPESKIDTEELELQIFQKEQKIIFRDQQINKLKNNIKILTNENKKLSESINKQLADRINKNVEIQNSEEKIKNIQSETQQKIKNLNQEIQNLKKDSETFNKSLAKNINENQLLKKDYKNLFNKNIKLVDKNKQLVGENKNLANENKNLANEKIDENKKLENLIQSLNQQIKEQKAFIKKLEDTSHH